MACQAGNALDGYPSLIQPREGRVAKNMGRYGRRQTSTLCSCHERLPNAGHGRKVVRDDMARVVPALAVSLDQLNLDFGRHVANDAGFLRRLGYRVDVDRGRAEVHLLVFEVHAIPCQFKDGPRSRRRRNGYHAKQACVILCAGVYECPELLWREDVLPRLWLGRHPDVLLVFDVMALSRPVDAGPKPEKFRPYRADRDVYAALRAVLGADNAATVQALSGVVSANVVGNLGYAHLCKARLQRVPAFVKRAHLLAIFGAVGNVKLPDVLYKWAL